MVLISLYQHGKAPWRIYSSYFVQKGKEVYHLVDSYLPCTRGMTGYLCLFRTRSAPRIARVTSSSPSKSASSPRLSGSFRKNGRRVTRQTAKGRSLPREPKPFHSAALRPRVCYTGLWVTTMSEVACRSNAVCFFTGLLSPHPDLDWT